MLIRSRAIMAFSGKSGSAGLHGHQWRIEGELLHGLRRLKQHCVRGHLFVLLQSPSSSDWFAECPRKTSILQSQVIHVRDRKSVV